MLKKALIGLWATCVCASLGTGTAAAATDIVLYASDATTLHGNWTRVSDPTAAGGQMLASADKGWSTTNHAQPSPADYVDFTFAAPAGTPYHVWVRLRAASNSKFNDSVYAQFSDAVSATGSPIYRPGTKEALTLNLETCANCALAGWGWADGAYWLAQTNPLRFATTGSHTLRIQTREDGVQLDQVVLSPATYLTSAPGQAMNDLTIVQKPAAPVATPFTGTAAAVPGTIEAEDFDNGGEGLGYHDTTAGNSGGQYRQTDVDIEVSADGGYDVGWIAPGEWLRYSVNVAAAGSYLLEARVASNGQGGTFHVEAGGTNVSGTLTIPNTGGWQTWTTISAPVTLTAGGQAMRVVFDANGATWVGNFNWLRFTAVVKPSGPTPYSGTALALPGTVRPENFDNGGEGVAYHDTTAGNSGGQYRQTGVDIETSAAGGYDIGWIADTEWLAYTVNVAAAGDYAVQFKVASPLTAGQIHAAFGSTSTSPVSVPNTGGWQTWSTVSVPVTLAAGQQVMKIVADVGGFNLAGVDVVTVAPPPPPPPPPAPPAPPPPPPPPAAGTVWTVNAGGDFQAALNAALPGDTIVLEAGATFTGNFVLPVKSGTSVITIRSSAPDASLPGPSARVTPADAPALPKLRSPNNMPAMTTAPGAHHYRLQTLEFLANVQGYGDILDLGDGSAAQNTLALVPHDLVVDRVYMHGDVAAGQKRGIGLNSASTTVTNSYIAEIKAVGQDSQAICGWNGPGPFTITNNYLEAAGENVLFGGSDPSIPNLVPSDITVTGNTLSKQVVWRTQSWSVKNLFELKNAQRVLVDGNVLEYNWQGGQAGYAVQLTPRNQNGTAPWAIVQQVQFTNNVVRHVAGGINILGTDNIYPSLLTNNLVIRNNLFADVSTAAWGGPGRFLMMQGGDAVTVDHNTVIEDGSSSLYASGAQATNFVFTNNIVPNNAWAIMGDNASPGNATILKYFPQGQFLDGIYIAAPTSSYPTGNYYPASAAAVGFVDLANGNYRLSASSPYRVAGTDGTDVGCNIDALNARTGTQY